MIGIVRVPSLPLVLPLRMIISERMAFAGVKTSMTFKLHASAMRQAVYRQTPKRARSREVCKPSLNNSSISACVRIFACPCPSIFILVYTRPDTTEFATNTALLHWSGVFLNAVGEMPREIRVIVDSVRNNRYRVL